MTSSERIERNIKRLQRLQTWQLVLLFILAAFLTLTFLRLNNIGMVERRSAVLSADEAGNSETTINRLYDLQQYVSAHMNTDLGTGVTLESSYKRDSVAAYETAAADSNPNGNIYKKAQEVCAPRYTRYSYAYLQCTTGELAKYPAAANPGTAVQLPNIYNYRHTFVTPLWSPDFAGWSLVVCGFLGLMILMRLTSLLVLRIALNYEYKRT